MNTPDNTAEHLDLSIVIPAYHETENLKLQLPRLIVALQHLDIQYEIIIVDSKPEKATAELARQHGVTLLIRSNTAMAGL